MGQNQKNPPYKGKILAGIFVIIALALNFAYPENSGENTGETSEKESTSQSETVREKKEFKIGASNAIALTGCIIALAVVKYRDNNIRK